MSELVRAIAIYAVIAAALLAGVAAAYGRELEARRRPDRAWWLRHLLVLPVLAIASVAVAESMQLTTSTAALGAALLALGGYKSLR